MGVLSFMDAWDVADMASLSRLVWFQIQTKRNQYLEALLIDAFVEQTISLNHLLSKWIFHINLDLVENV